MMNSCQFHNSLTENKYLGMNLTKEVKDRYSENFESLNEKVGDVRK